MKKFSFFLIVLLLTRVGSTYASPDTTKGLDVQNFFLGGGATSNVNVNQVLALLVGPSGKPGAAGVAGKDGFVGMNGQDGKDGLPGAPGPIGPQGVAGAPGAVGPVGPAGASVASVILNPGDPNCAYGGSKFIIGDGSATFACNGAPGSAGANGANGAKGDAGLSGKNGIDGKDGAGILLETEPIGANCANGGSKLTATGKPPEYVCNGTSGSFSTGSLVDGNGLATIESCDDAVRLGMLSHYVPSLGEFIFDGIRVSGIKSACSNSQVTITLSTNNKNDTITCHFDLGVLTDPENNTAYLVDKESTLADPTDGKKVNAAPACIPLLSTVNSRLLDPTFAFQFG